MRLEDEFAVPLPLEQVWPVLVDVPTVATCLPGAAITGEDGGVYRGTIGVRIGPIHAEYAGTATLAEVDEDARRVVLEASGTGKRGVGVASATIEATVHEDGGGTVVAVHTDLRLSGKVAQFGSAAIKPVSAMLLSQFARNLHDRIAAGR